MHEMQPIVTDDCGVCQSSCLSRSSTGLHCVKMAKQIKIDAVCGEQSWGPSSSREQMKLETRNFARI